MRNIRKLLASKLEDKKPNGTTSRRRKDNIAMDLKEEISLYSRNRGWVCWA
jgi:hypothetical protein